MKTSPSPGIEVFDFKDEELSESIAGKFCTKLKNPSSGDNSVLKDEFLECGMLYVPL